MSFSPYSIGRAPRSLPIWQTILDDLGRPHPSRVAKLLGVGERTVYRWNRTGQAPKAACLALFWLTRWGRSEIDCAAVNDCRVAIGYARALEADLARAKLDLARILALNEHGAPDAPALAPARQPKNRRGRP